ncbi:hypothetical protein CHS0354_034922 [Potamilus streckersoni]|uniref:ubiquitinyl hydrolase 1 n=1 Tax=Potamilus streckersoni TaxID=2493646 RepID=A0AAE0SDX9_9BIVA|nr:hypothetical protein CHS0354_034922 [Potamilus streckersoni]
MKRNEDQEPEFPMAELSRLDDMIHRPRWVVPVLPKGELNVLIDSAIRLCKEGRDTRSKPCQRFIHEGLTVSFTKIMNDEAVFNWKYEIHKCILKNAEKLIELVQTKLLQDCFPLLELLAIVFNPQCNFHSYHATQPSETVATGSAFPGYTLFARPAKTELPQGWLVDLINRFGAIEGFQILFERFTNGCQLSVPVIAALIKPFGQCSQFLTPYTMLKYFMPILDVIQTFLDGITDEQLKKESQGEVKNDVVSSIIESLKQLLYRFPNKKERIKKLEIFRLKMIMRLMKISIFKWKMNALNELNTIIANISLHRYSQWSDDQWLTSDTLLKWIKENDVLSIILQDSLHQPQYVEKVEKILQFMIKENVLSPHDLYQIWEAQQGKPNIIVKNFEDLIVKLASNFSMFHMDQYCECFQRSWACTPNKQREKLLSLIRRLAEDDKEGVITQKVLDLLWNLACSEDVPTDIMYKALTAQIEILEDSCIQKIACDAQKITWIQRFVEELKKEMLVLPALIQIRNIVQLFPEEPQNFPHDPQRTSHVNYRVSVIRMLQNCHGVGILVSNDLSNYMSKTSIYAKGHPGIDPANIFPDCRFNHIQQVQQRLHFLRFLLQHGKFWLCENQANQIWQCLAENAIYPTDREACFRWFAKLMGEEEYLSPDITRDFFEKNILQMDPRLLTENGMNCFERFFQQVNVQENKLLKKGQSGYMMDDLELIGIDYLWQVVIWSSDEVAEIAIALLKDVFTNLGPRLQQKQVEIHEDFIQSCVDRLEALYDSVSILEKEKDSPKRVIQECIRMIRVLTVLKEYVSKFDEIYGNERSILPLSRAYRGKVLSLSVCFPNQGRQMDNMDIWSHTNDTIGSVRRQILHRLKASSNTKVDLYVNAEILDPSEDMRVISQIPLRHKMLIRATLVHVADSVLSSSDSSSTGSPHHIGYKGPNTEEENCLPGVLMANNPRYVQFLFQLSDLGCSLPVHWLRDAARQLLRLMTADSHILEKFQIICAEHVKSGSGVSLALESMFFNASPTEVLYNIEVAYSLLMPAVDPLSEDAFEFQHNFVRSGGVQLAINILTKDSFLPTADLSTRRSAYVTALKICKLMLTTVGYAKLQVVMDAIINDLHSPGGTAEERSHAVILQKALHHIPDHTTEFTTRNVAVRLGKQLMEQATGVVPDLSIIKAIQSISLSASSGSLHLVHASVKAHEKDQVPDPDDLVVAKEALEVLTVCILLCPSATEVLHKEKAWQLFIIDSLLICKHRPVRISAAEQFFLMATKCSSSQCPLVFFITLLFTVLSNVVTEHAKQASEYFQLLCRLLNFACSTDVKLPNTEKYLDKEIAWLKKVRDQVVETGETTVDDVLLEGHLRLTSELLAFQSIEKKNHTGSNLIKDLVEYFVFPASKLVLQSRKSTGEFPSDQAIPVCSTATTITAAFDLAVALCTGCITNFKSLSDMLMEMFYNGQPSLIGWEYLPPNPRAPTGFVGLKNAKATDYMNSVLQQLFMIEHIRTSILSVDCVEGNIEEEYITEEREETSEEERIYENPLTNKDEERKECNHGILKQIQLIFGNLAASRQKYYVPRGFWKHFKLCGQPVNIHEQHDAIEFFNSLVESVDESLKKLNQPALLLRVMGGSFANQKICKDCPHRYQREEFFTTLNVDIRNHQNLLESMEQYVMGDFLEGANAYHCEKCNKKVDTIKRQVIKKLPEVLVIQLKRFEFDWERESRTKCNDYFEFPREFNMEPYTVQGLAKLEGEIIDADSDEMGQCTKYKLIGVVVHNGEATGRHYYSFILHRGADRVPKWYKFDDVDVSECKMEDDEEMKNQCFGGEYLGEVFDKTLKRMAYRRQKRKWNAYILFYERQDQYERETNDVHDLTLSSKTRPVKIPASIEKCVHKHNILFMHERMHFSLEYFQFMKKLLNCNMSGKMVPDAEQLSMISIELASKFLFGVGFHTTKAVRGSANDWYEGLNYHLRLNKNIRGWFMHNSLFPYPNRFSKYLLECPISEVRSAFCKIIVCLAHYSLQDGPASPPLIPGLYADQVADPSVSQSDHLLMTVLQLLKKEVSDHGRNLQQYFHLFLMYANLGLPERSQLLKLNVPAQFMSVALDEGPGPPIKYQYAELTRLYCVVSLLIRCCDVSSQCHPSTKGKPLPNPHGDVQPPLLPIQPKVAEMLFKRTSYIKKLIEDCNNNEDTTKLFRFCCWENPHFSSAVLRELLWQVAHSYTYELRPYLDLLLQMLMLEDSWQNHRIHNALKGILEERNGLFDTIEISKDRYQKRAYQCIKMLVAFFSHCYLATSMLNCDGDLIRRWSDAVEWLHDELGKMPHSETSSAQSNETSNGFPLQRSNSAQITLAKAIELIPDTDSEEEDELTDVQENSQGNDQSPSHNHNG